MTATDSEKRFKLKHLPRLIVDTYKAWEADDPFRLSAIIAYYAVLSLPGLLVIIVNLVGSVWGTEIVQGELTQEISSALGRDAAEAIQSMMIETQNKDRSTIASILGIGTLVFGATGVFYHLQLSLNQIWEVDPKPDSNFIKMLIDRARSFAFILAIGFLLLISFLVTAAISALNGYIRSILPDVIVYIAYILDFAVSVGIITVLFALIFRYLPDTKIRWKTVWIGALITAVLFVLGKSLLGYYFGEADPGSTYGAAGTIVLILLWVSYSCLILFFGAEFTWVYARRYGHGVPKESSEKLVE
ncbi:YihY/virulence factor BrkB family protein [Zobellia galactanivorans]|uniref:Ribonuclease BN family protein n=1 Tax=Zobellia galactanivorans (strain DSM 12802 / CCUG 47099 / CIP 106680 / NCIMB 13871 / Dsij) TaxID=63186 RepID=G0LA81_ZOBGA|nr:MULTISPECIES: YihY/virulence factor BrkB family protein [Zobellia]MDO6810456.1 YihY/virulence factor BrkB family protein [Zobellia galactanivorans]OWW26189.1 ribonuclease BN [Zobellia sp. OII3]CAZ95128.1 Ribonuclease BN family protein [Zobellia galactanivorans]